MAINKTDALILKSIKLRETSKILTLFTRQFGLEKLVAKGARSFKSHYYGSLEPLNHVNIVFYHKPNRDLQLLHQADIIHSFPGIRQNLNKTAHALAICEIILKTQFAAEPNERLFQLILGTFLAINQTPFSPFLNYLAFELKMLDLTGLNPNLSHCFICKKEINNQSVKFEPAGGGIVCEHCIAHENGLSLSNKGLRFLNWLREQAQTEICQHQIPITILHEADKILSAYMDYHLEDFGPLKAMDFILRIQQNDIS